MIQHQHMKVPIETEGLGRKKRQIPSLNPSYVKLDDRTKEELFEFVQQYSSMLRFVDRDGKEKGSWESFFEKIPEKDGKSTPHLALLMAFLELLQLSQNKLNEVIKRHLDYYYLNILQLQKKAPAPAVAHAILELSDQVSSFHLPEGTTFLAGKNEKGEDQVFRTPNATQLTQAKVVSVKSLFLQGATPPSNAATSGIFGEEVWNENSLDRTWNALGSSSLPAVDIGFAVTAPILHLPEGIRTIKLSVLMQYTGNIDSLDLDLLNSQIDDQFNIALSTETGWIFKTPSSTSMSKGENKTELVLNIQLALGKTEHPIVAQTASSLPTSWPVLKVLLNPNGNYNYELFKQCAFVTIDIDVHVEDVKDLVIQNNESVLSTNAPFYPFTLNPGINAEFFIGSTEIFQKNLTSIDLKLNWHNVPNEQLGDHYASYPNAARANKDFRSYVEILKYKDWFHVTDVGLFSQENARHAKRLNIQAPGFSLEDQFDGLQVPSEPEVELEIGEGGNLQIGEAEALEKVESYGIKSERGFIRLRLSEPDFGHAEYPNLYASTITKNNLAKDETSLLPLPNQPYNPELKSVSLSYSANKEVDLLNSDKYFFQLHPFGHKQADASKGDSWLFPQLTGEGQLLVGLENVQGNSEVSLLIQCIEGSADPEAQIPAVQWSYLENDQWVDFSSSAILYDSTENFNKPGVITFSIPQRLMLDHSILPKGLFWVKASAIENSAGTCRIQKIQAQAIVLESVIDKSGSHTALVPPFSISKLEEPLPEIKKVEQPYASILGRELEAEEVFYQRISERIRHKNRVLNIWDCERMVLEQFPSIYKVKCFKNTDSAEGFTPGAYLTIIIPDVRQQEKEDALQPMASLQLRDSVQKFLARQGLPQVEIQVRNPLFEPIELEFMVKFRHGYHNGLHEQQLQQELKEHLAPWAYDDGVEIGLGGKVYKSAILNFVEERPYVDFVTFFKMNQYDQDGNGRMNVEEAFAITPVSVLTSSAHHQITVLDSDDMMCADGIGHMVVEDSFTTIK